MAGEKVKKGFAFYLLMLILILVAAFFVIITIMIFSPGQDILGFKYFSYNDTLTYIETTNDERPIDFSSISQINVECGSASVNVRKGSVENDTISITNNSIGFAKASDNTDFTHSITLEGTTLNIAVTEPQGFLHFSNDISINIIVPETAPEGESVYGLQNTELVIKTGSGNVNIGLSNHENEELDATNTISPRMVDISTGSGTITFNKYCDSNFTDISLYTTSGRITSNISLKVSDEDAYIGTESGTVDLGNVTFVGMDGVNKDVSKILNVQNSTGTISIDEMAGTVSIVTESGTFNFGTVEGHLSANNTRDRIDSPTINANHVMQDVSIPYGNGANISLGQVDGQVNIATISGNVRIGYDSNLSSTSWISTDSGNIEAYIADRSGATGVIHNFETNSGSIAVTYNSEIRSANSLVSNSGNLTLNIRSRYPFLLEVKDSAEEYRTLSENVSFEFIDSNEYEMPFYLNNYTGNENRVLMQTDGEIRGYLIPIA